MNFSLSVADAICLALMLGAAVWTILTPDLLRSAIGLAVTSAVLTLLIFRVGMPLAGVFELSVCAGLITVVFISTISLTAPATDAEARAEGLKRWRRYILLPVILIGACWLLCLKAATLGRPIQASSGDVRTILWLTRRFDLVGQILVILAGVFGVVVLFKARGASGEKKE